MKKLLIALFGFLVLAGCANDPYKIDPVATANAPWEVGQRVGEFECLGDSACYNVFLGILTDTRILLQGFYSNGNKFTDPYAGVMSLEDKVLEFDGPVTFWYENGQKRMETFTLNGVQNGFTIAWYENGQKQYEGSYKDGNFVGLWHYWDEKGNLIEEVDFGISENQSTK